MRKILENIAHHVEDTGKHEKNIGSRRESIGNHGGLTGDTSKANL